MKDFSFWMKFEGASEGSGRSEKLWLINPDTDQTGLFKFKKDETTTDHVSECIACDLAELLEIPCAKFEIGIYHEREGSISYNIVDHTDQILIEGIYCISSRYQGFDVEKLKDTITGDKYSIEMIKKVLDPFGLFYNFLKILIFDFLIGNTDRHQSNWALIPLEKGFELSPLYDNSSSLCAYVKEDKIDQYLGKDMRLWRSLIDTKSRSLIRISVSDEKQPTHLDVLKYLRQNYYSQTIETVNKIELTVTESSLDNILYKYAEVLTDKKITLIKKYLLEKIELMKEVYGTKREE